jgi:hypothetical protein
MSAPSRYDEDGEFAQHAFPCRPTQLILQHFPIRPTEEPGHLHELCGRLLAQHGDDVGRVSSAAELPKYLQYRHVRFTGAILLDILLTGDVHLCCSRYLGGKCFYHSRLANTRFSRDEDGTAYPLQDFRQPGVQVLQHHVAFDERHRMRGSCLGRWRRLFSLGRRHAWRRESRRGSSASATGAINRGVYTVSPRD